MLPLCLRLGLPVQTHPFAFPAPLPFPPPFPCPQYRQDVKVAGTSCKWFPRNLNATLCTHVNYSFAFVKGGNGSEQHTQGRQAGSPHSNAACAPPALPKRTRAADRLQRRLAGPNDLPSFLSPTQQITPSTPPWSGTTRPSCTQKPWRCASRTLTSKS